MGKILFKQSNWVDKCYSDYAPSETTVQRWYADFKCAHTDTNDAECSGPSNSIFVPENIKSSTQYLN